MRNFILDNQIKLLLIFAFATISFCQIYPSYNYQPQKFTATYTVVPNPADIEENPIVKLFLYVPHTSLTFIRDEKQYIASYSFSAGLYKKNRQLIGDTGKKQISVNNYTESIKPKLESVDSLMFPMPSGEYDIKISVSDAQASGNMTLLLENIKVPDMSDGWVLTNPVFVDSSNKPMSVVETNDSVTFITNYSALDCSNIVIRHFFQDEDFSVCDTIIDTRIGVYRKKILLAGISGGLREFKAELTCDGKNKANSSTTIRFKANYLNMNKDDFRNEMHLLSIFGTRKEIKAIRNAESEDRDSLVALLWYKRDPTPSTERNEFRDEFMTRVEYANEHFSGMRPGYRSDIGKVYIEFGPPDEIERHPFDPDSYAYVKWFYFSHHTVYTFVDKLGDGEYVLWSVE